MEDRSSIYLRTAVILETKHTKKITYSVAKVNDRLIESKAGHKPNPQKDSVRQPLAVVQSEAWRGY